MQKSKGKSLTLIIHEKANRFHNFWILCVIGSYLCLNYVASYGSRLSMIATGLIILFSYLSWPNTFKQLLGIPVKLKQYCIIIVCLPVIFFSTYLLINYLSLQNGIGFRSTANFFGLDHIFFYTLNEEFILGALLLLSLKNKFKNLNPIFISITVAVAFSVPHYIIYRWIFEANAQGIINLFTLFSLFFIGVLRNNLILKTNHIGYSWALHFSWVKIMLGFFFYNYATMDSLSEVQRFNLFIGNELTFVIVFVLASLSTVWLFLKKDKKLIQ